MAEALARLTSMYQRPGAQQSLISGTAALSMMAWLTSGAGSAFSPKDISNCVMWLRADKGITIGTGVSVWADQSGNSNDFSQGTGSNQPPLVSSDANLNGQASIGPWNATTAKSLAYAGANTYVGPWTFVLIHYTASAPAGNRYAFGNNTSNRGDLYTDGSGYQHALCNQAANDIYAASAGSGVGKHCVIVDELAAGSKIYLDSSTAASTGAPWTVGTMFAFGQATIGSYAGDAVSNTYNFPGYIAEIILYNRTLSAGEKDQVLTYSRARYGTP